MPNTDHTKESILTSIKKMLGIQEDYEHFDPELVKTYVYDRVKLMFDPPASGFLVDSLNKQIAEFEFRMNVQAEKDKLYLADMSGIFVSE